MRHDSTDLRVQRTLKSIRSAFYELILEKPYAQISITELTARADINRKTFYLHYSSLDSLIIEIEEEMVETILSRLEGIGKVDVATCISVFYHFLSEADEVQEKLLCDPQYSFCYEAMTNALLDSETFKQFYQDTEHPELMRAYSSAITRIYRIWRSSDTGMTIEELIDYACRLMLTGYEGTVK